MPDSKSLSDLVDYLARMMGVSHATAARAVGEVVGFLDELPEEFVCRRHRELQKQGWSNPEIFARVSVEIASRRFRAPDLSPRQIRRIIYG
jgi:hypothetical protein